MPVVPMCAAIDGSLPHQQSAMPDSAAPSTPHVEALDKVVVENFHAVEVEPPCGAAQRARGGELPRGRRGAAANGRLATAAGPGQLGGQHRRRRARRVDPHGLRRLLGVRGRRIRRSFGRGGGRRRVTIGSLFHLATERGWRRRPETQGQSHWDGRSRPVPCPSNAAAL